MKRPGLFLFLLSTAVYLNCLVNDFTYDDFYYIVYNEDIRQAFWRLFLNPYRLSNLYRPLGSLSFAVSYIVGGLNPIGYHLVNVLLHGAVTVLLYRVVQEVLDRPGAALAAATLFAVHPIHTEAVTAAVGRTELQAAALVLAAWLLHLRGRALPAAGCFLLALLSKESAAAFLVLAPLGDYARRQFRPAGVYARYLAAFCAFVVLWWSAVGELGLGLVPPLDNPLAQLPPWWRVLNALRVAWKYVALQVFPAVLSCDYSFNAIPVTRSWKSLWPALLATAAVLLLWLWSARRNRAVFLAGGIYLAGFALTSNVLFPIGTIMGERLAYLPSAGLCLLAGLAWEKLVPFQLDSPDEGPGPWADQPQRLGSHRLAQRVGTALAARRRTAAVGALAVIALALGVRTLVRNHDWRDNITLFASAVRAAPESAKSHYNLGVEYLNLNRLQEARQQFLASYSIYPVYPDLLVMMGVLEYRLGDKKRAVALMESGLGRTGRDNPNYDTLVTTYAALLIEMRYYDSALALLDHVIAGSPNFSRAYSNRAVIRYYRGQVKEARADAETALRLSPANHQARALLQRMENPGAKGPAPQGNASKP